MARRRLLGVTLALAVSASCFTGVAVGERSRLTVSTETIRIAGTRHRYVQCVPDTGADKSALPAVVLLHGSNGDGRSMVRAWSDLARRTGIVLVAPDASDRAEWSVPNDGPESLVRIVEQVTERTSRVDPRRIYLFGHSAGAVFTLYMAALEGDYFAAAVAHGGALGGEGSLEGGAVSRRAPVLLLVGTDDWYATPAKVEATRQQFAAIGQPLLLEWLSGRGHEYLGVSDEVNERAWRFLQAQRLTADPVYHPFNFAERPGR